MILIITYDLKTPKDYHDFYEAIKAQATEGKWWHYMASTWLLSTTKAPRDVVEAIRPFIDGQDFLFVCEITANYQGWLPKPAWDWLQTELPLRNFMLDALQALSKQASLPPPPNPFLDALSKLPPPPKPK
jgi:hypothetical protein